MFRARHSRRRWSCQWQAKACSYRRRFFDQAACGIGVIRQLEMSIERGSPRARALGPFDQNDCRLARHVVKIEVTRLVGMAQPVAIHVIDWGLSGVVIVDQRIGGTGGTRLRAQAAADGLNEGRLPRAQLSRQPDYGRGAELSAEVLTEPAELARGEAHRQP